MQPDAKRTQHNELDPAWIAKIADAVLARLDSTTGISLLKPTSEIGITTEPNTIAVEQKVITAATIESLAGTPSQISIPAKAVVTPAARDIARQRKIAILRTVDNPDTKLADKPSPQIIDYANTERAEAIRDQLAMRGVDVGDAKIVLSDTPAKEVYFQCVKKGEVAVMIGAIADVERFASELSPTLWVLDMKRLNFTAAVNVAAQISNQPTNSR